MHAEKLDAQVFRFDQSGALLRKVMESAAVGMTLVGIDGRVIFSNRAFETMLGCPPDYWLGRPADEMQVEEDRQALRLRYGQLMRGEIEEFRIECRARHMDGAPIWVLAAASLVRSDTNDSPLYTIIQLINIDRQKRAEAALADTESRWNFALESAGQGVWDHDIRRDDMFYSNMWRKMRGIPLGEYVDPAQEAWLARVHPDDVPRVLATVAKQDSGEQGYETLEYRERHRDGHYMWILSRGKPVEWDENGTAVRTVGTDTDITPLKQAEFQLAEEKERLRVTLESIGEGVISTDSDGRVHYMNPMAEQFTGWTEAEAQGHQLWEVFVTKFESTGEPAPDLVGRCLQFGVRTEIAPDVVMISRGGSGRGVAGTASPVRSEDGHVVGAVLVVKDVTEDQAQQRQLAHSANHDALTGLPNRPAFARALTEACRQADTEQRSHALCFIDLDRFKPVNDGAGHAAGDALLERVAQILRQCCRSNDFAARLGGDEFVVLLADCDLHDARVIAQKMAASIGAIDFTWNGSHYAIGASVGIAPVISGVECDVLALADAACYAAKASGRGRVVVSGD